MMKDSSGDDYRHERALRAIQVSAVSGFLEDNRKLMESCLAICNWCRESVPLKYLTVDRQVPSTLLAVLCPDVVSAEAECSSRVVQPRRVLDVRLMFDDSVATRFVEAEEEEKEEEAEEGEEEGEGGRKEEDEEEERENKEKVESGLGTGCSIDTTKIRWPEGLRKIFLVHFNRPLDGPIGPDCLRVLAFHVPSRVVEERAYIYGMRGIFNRPLDGVTFPAGLRELYLGHNFNQRVDVVAWPQGLERLSMPGFNHPIQDVQWPPGLKTLEFIQPGELERRQFLNHWPWDMQEWGFDQPLGTSLPMSLETLLLSDNFDQPLRGVTWPGRLAVLGLGAGLAAESINGVKWPPSLRKMVCSDCRFDVQDAPPRL